MLQLPAHERDHATQLRYAQGVVELRPRSSQGLGFRGFKLDNFLHGTRLAEAWEFGDLGYRDTRS